jgi:membrane associated rhomboid family serine protease
LYGRGPQIGFGPPATPDVIKALIAANCAVYLVQALGPASFSALFSVTPELVWEHGFLWQVATYMWLHAESPLHLLFNMFALWMFGSQVASAWGTQRFLRFYLVCGVGAGVLIAAWPGLLELLGFATSSYSMPTLGASGAVYGVLLAFSLLWPDRTIMLLFPPIPLKAIWFIPFLFFMEVVTPGARNVSHVGHLGGVLVGYVALRMMGLGGRASFGQLRWRLKRWRMRRQLRAVRMDELRERERERDRDRDRDRRNFH